MSYKSRIVSWSKRRALGLFVFNLTMMSLVMLRSAGYFHPFLPLTISVVVFIGIVLSVPLLGANSKVVFIYSLLFWLLAAFFRVMNVDIWAERTAIYTFQSMLVGLVLFVLEVLR